MAFWIGLRRHFLPAVVAFLALPSPATRAPAYADVPARAPDPDWARAARRLTGESDSVRTRALVELAAIPGLAERLRSALDGPHAFLALDVAVAVGTRELVPELMRRLPRDREGYFVHALNALAAPADRPALLARYAELLGGLRELSAPARVALLDSLARAGAPLRPAVARDLLSDRVPEVRAAVLDYIRARIERGEGRGGEWPFLFARAFADRARQVRAQAHFALAGLRASGAPIDRAPIEVARVSCRFERDPEVAEACRRLSKGGMP